MGNKNNDNFKIKNESYKLRGLSKKIIGSDLNETRQSV